MKIETEQEIQLVEKLVDRLGRKLAMVLIACGMIMSVQRPDVISDNAIIWFDIAKMSCMAAIAIAGILSQYVLDRQPKE